MPRRRRCWADKACYHVTHRCHERRFLLKFAKHRKIYLQKLFEATRRFKVDILDYMVTSNHVHLLLTARHGGEISAALQFLHGGIAQKFNILKEREVLSGRTVFSQPESSRENICAAAFSIST